MQVPCSKRLLEFSENILSVKEFTLFYTYLLSTLDYLVLEHKLQTMGTLFCSRFCPRYLARCLADGSALNKYLWSDSLQGTRVH